MSNPGTNDPAATTTLLNRIFYAVDRMADVIEGRGLKPMVEYVERYRDVIDSAADAERIADDL